MSVLARSLLCLCLSVAPVAAQDPERSVDKGFDLLDQGARILLQSLLDQTAPALQDLQDHMGAAVARMGPALRDILARIDDIRNYDPPEMLPNGDIILRRRQPPAQSPSPGLPDASGQIDL